MLRGWFSGVTKMLLVCKEAVSLWVLAVIGGFATGFFCTMLKRVVYAAFICIFALGGSMVGTVVGAMKGQTTETGFLRGAGIGAVAGAITAIQLPESVADGEPLSKVAILTSLVNGKVFTDWVSPALLKAYQWQISTLETTYREISDVYDVNGVKGLSKNSIQRLPEYTMDSEKLIQLCHEFSCSVCLQDFQGGDCARKLPNCGHIFHQDCIDKWLTRNGSCPVCRNCVYEDD
ncbi:hypothetical protein QYF36_026281 [Acer negundo]|nr:hypothetical protein QYF36_026281 [Acer negundo]